MQTVTLFATMRDGSVLVERTRDFGQFVGLVLGFRKDADGVRLVWRVQPPAPTTPAAAGRPALAFAAAR